MVYGHSIPNPEEILEEKNECKSIFNSLEQQKIGFFTNILKFYIVLFDFFYHNIYST